MTASCQWGIMGGGVGEGRELSSNEPTCVSRIGLGGFRVPVPATYVHVPDFLTSSDLGGLLNAFSQISQVTTTNKVGVGRFFFSLFIFLCLRRVMTATAKANARSTC